MTKNKAFTLIELLVVIAIIGILAATILISLNNIREKARDKTRKADLNMIKNALEMYYSREHTFPPGTASDPDLGDGDCFKSDSWGSIETLMNDYISLPKDPLNTDPNLYIYKKVDSSSYYLYARLENSKDPDCKNQPNCGLETPCAGFPQMNYEIKG